MMKQLTILQLIESALSTTDKAWKRPWRPLGIVMDALLILWQLPGFLLGLAIIIAYRKEILLLVRIDYRDFMLHFDTKTPMYIPIWFVKFKDGFRPNLREGICTGPFVILDDRSGLMETLWHEIGHAYQSVMFGPLYLLIIGIVSITREIYSEIKRKRDTNWNWYFWYYQGWPEKWADMLGGVIRFTKRFGVTLINSSFVFAAKKLETIERKWMQQGYTAHGVVNKSWYGAQ